MNDYWLAATIGAGTGVLVLASFAFMPKAMRAPQGVLIFNVMLWIYVGAQLASGTLDHIIAESVFALVAGGAAQAMTLKWPPSVGIAILFHGAYDAIMGPHTGVAEWYPPLCAGFDLLVGVGLTALLVRDLRNADTAA
ncbi:MAG: hypothetical protein AAF692_09760 [Pseudomonadota bacterium]